MSELHRKRRKSYNIPGHAHCLTYSCHGGAPLLNNDRSRGWVVQAMDRARVRHSFAIWAYVIMPEHVHLVVKPSRDVYSVAAMLYSLKRPVAWRAKEFLLSTGQQRWLERLTVMQRGRHAFRFWQAGGGHDRNITSVAALENIVQYIHANPVRAGLAPEATGWHWSSAAWWAGTKTGPLRVDAVGIGF